MLAETQPRRLESAPGVANLAVGSFVSSVPELMEWGLRGSAKTPLHQLGHAADERAHGQVRDSRRALEPAWLRFREHQTDPTESSGSLGVGEASCQGSDLSTLRALVPASSLET